MCVCTCMSVCVRVYESAYVYMCMSVHVYSAHIEIRRLMILSSVLSPRGYGDKTQIIKH